MAGASILVAAVVFISFVYTAISWLQTSRSRSKISKEYNCKPARKYPHKDPLGIDYFLANKKAYEEHRLLDKYDEDFDKYGDTHQFKFFGGVTIITRDPELLKACMQTDFDSWGVADIRFKAGEPFLGTASFFILDGPEWKHLRALSRPALARSEYGDLPRLERHYQKMLKLVPKDESTVDMKPLFDRLLQSFASEYFMGEAADVLREDVSEEHRELIDSVNIAADGMSQRFLMGKLIRFLPVDKTFLKASRIVQKFVDKNVDKAFQRSYDEKSTSDEETHRIFLDDMVKQSSDRKFVSEGALGMFMAGAETTSASLNAIFFALSRNPEVVRKLRDEIATMSSGPPGLEVLQKMKYLRAVIHEAMRLYGVTSGPNFRTALKDTVLPQGGGPDGKSPIFVKKGTVLCIIYRAIHTNPMAFGPDAKEFRPERHLEEKYDYWQFQPFSSGPRVCPGQHMAFTTLCYVTTRLLQEFKAVESRDDRPWAEFLKLAVENIHGTKVGMIPADA